ncbi:hypothetical protein B0H17DRAFT_1180773 [Mycena rosella]|uniref:Uncharacterized protein n=1 Tax=Mycena rosella TaxID=1033263 RepID=A0AAD7GC66_MYCRO|nr:hypothetical protein B0H17DRAFT_1180773 [Mycena rosella]
MYARRYRVEYRPDSEANVLGICPQDKAREALRSHNSTSRKKRKSESRRSAKTGAICTKKPGKVNTHRITSGASRDRVCAIADVVLGAAVAFVVAAEGVGLSVEIVAGVGSDGELVVVGDRYVSIAIGSALENRIRIATGPNRKWDRRHKAFSALRSTAPLTIFWR